MNTGGIGGIGEAYPPQRLVFELRRDPGFVPPPAVAALAGQGLVDLDLVLGVQYYYSAVEKREPSYGVLADFYSQTAPYERPHRFIGTSLAVDDEEGKAQSNRYGRVVGISFMSGHAGLTWYAPVKTIWNGLNTAGPTIAFERPDEDIDRPDYLGAPFSVEHAKDLGLDPLYVLEFKGHKQRVTFESPTFTRWIAQATNLRATAAAKPVKLKSWVLAFNYGFVEPRGSRAESTLLVADPWAGDDDARPPAASPETIEPIIREHLARQCRKLGASRLAPFISSGRMAEGVGLLPPVYKIRHPALADRRYMGIWGTLDQDGEFIPQAGPGWHFGGGPKDIEVHFHGPGFAHGYVRFRDGSAEFDFRLSGAFRRPADAERMLRGLLAGRGGDVFIGQDATMLKECMRTQVGVGLRGAAFTDMREVLQLGSPDQRDVGGSIIVIRNGHAVADSTVVEPEESADGWWYT